MLLYGSLPVSNVLDFISDESGTKANLVMDPLNGITNLTITVGVSSLRLRCFKKSTVCVKCGRTGTIFIAEKSSENEVSPHLNLYSVEPNGEFVLMTHDHIIPKSRGGANHISNVQTMCAKCNHKKSDSMPFDTQERLKEYVKYLFEDEKSDKGVWDTLQNYKSEIVLGFKVRPTDIISLLRTFMEKL